MPHKDCCTNTTRLSVMMGLVFSYFVVELVVGHLTRSISLVADSFHMLSDFVGLIVGLCALRISKWPRGSKNTFGWQRAEVLGALVNTVVLTTLCFTLIIEAIQRYITPEILERPRLMLGVGGGGLLINLIGLAVLWNRGGHGHSHGAPPQVVMMEVLNAVEEEIECPEDAMENGQIMDGDQSGVPAPIAKSESLKLLNERQGDQSDANQSNVDAHHGKTRGHSSAGHGHSHSGRSRQGGMNMKAVFLHVLSDALGSVIVMVSAAIFTYVPGDPETDAKWKQYIDPSMTMIIVVIILANVIPLLRQASLILLQSVPKDIHLDTLQKELNCIDGIDAIHDLHVWQLQPNCLIGTVHLKCSDPQKYSAISQTVKTLFHERGIHCTTIQPEFNKNTNGCDLTCGSGAPCGKEKTCCPESKSLKSSPNADDTEDHAHEDVPLTERQPGPNTSETQGGLTSSA